MPHHPRAVALAAPPTRPPAQRVAPAHLRLVPSLEQPPLPFERDAAPAHLGEGVPEETDRVARRVATLLVEVLQGRRPLAHLDGVLAAEVHSTVTALVRARVGDNLRLRSVRVQAPAPGVAEASVHVSDGVRSRALAMRLEARQGRWRCVLLEVALTSASVSRFGRGSS